MSIVGSLIFCTQCGDLLDNPSDVNNNFSNNKSTNSNIITCNHCNCEYDKHNFDNLKVSTKSANNAFPSKLANKKNTLVKTTIGKNDDVNGATIKETCPNCNNDEMQFHTLQLRSADEGATVFRTCPKCNFKDRVNN
ncbi:hypothetical protein FOG51_00155 [Hanseniaspora uvarum]|uniref:DNA-directed RNA polymerase subunit n=1 Tax=Hanseniaspora uvarum TaxID=29833 RepID=A0A1E5RKD5_HANUV|nr:hypothetical protein FOG48_02814 [Hanseniaspora uvarum]KAF0274977.1 hypothetical protein FOG51_00155 [Hanseniaspora uvarum]KAF0279116.1 hypothetical protein FOG50_00023 [Hanseniaspora uvarum]OEJ87314.1 DNA-directed RNA polymerase I subunit RPA12 [Hanseniaspora uvarum]GMM39669.1 DNA-directed RNA polymerase I core subunit [Hanseniaspora uvarum]